jgi:hypothetical protein
MRSLERQGTKIQANAVAKRQAAAPDDALAGKLESIRKQWEGGDQAGARAALEVFLREHPGYVLPADFPVPRPAPPVPQEAPVQGR